jgi:hypothetical protein
MEFRRDQFRVDPTIAIDTAFKIAEGHAQQIAGTGRSAGSTTLPDCHTIGYDVFLDEDGIDRFELYEGAEPSPFELQKQHKRYNSKYWDEGSAELYGEPPFPERRLFIEYGGGPYITLKIHFDQNEGLHGYMVESRSRTFVPRSYPDDELIHYRVTREQLKEWIYEFLPNDPNRIYSRDDVDFTAGGQGHERLKQRVVRFLDGLPDVEVNPPTGLVEKEDLENFDMTVSQRSVFETAYVAGLLDISGWYAEDMCEELCREDEWPVVSLDPPGDTSFKYHRFVIAHEDQWGDCEEYDYSTYKHEGARRITY